MHIYLHGFIALTVPTHICPGSHSGSLHRHLTRYVELLLKSMLASLDTSVTAFFLPGQVTLQEARSGPKRATRHPTERAAHPRQQPASFTRPVTPQQCVGGFFTQWESGTWVQQDLSGICVDDELARAADLLMNLKTVGLWTLKKICTYDHASVKQEKLFIKQHNLEGLL